MTATATPCLFTTNAFYDLSGFTYSIHYNEHIIDEKIYTSSITELQLEAGDGGFIEHAQDNSRRCVRSWLVGMIGLLQNISSSCYPVYGSSALPSYNLNIYVSLTVCAR